MKNERNPGPPLPEDRRLREIAEAMEDAGVSGELLDADWKIVFISSEEARIVGVAPDEVGRFYGKSLVVRQLEDADVWGIDEESQRNWWSLTAPIMRRDLSPGDDAFDEAFGPRSEQAAMIEPVSVPPLAWSSRSNFLPDLELRHTVLGDIAFLELRVNDEDGRLLGVIRFGRTALPESLLARLGRGDRGLFERMDRVRDPGRRPAAILFADLEGSGPLSRRLSSGSYFALIGGLTDLIDSAVIAGTGIVGKHAGDGGSALFLAADFEGSESAAARAAIEASRAIREGAADLGPAELSPKVNVGLHWGGTLMVGQVATNGRLEVTALGDAMNEAARIEAAATEGAILASKELIERLGPGDASATGIDPDAIDYVPLGEREGAGDKVVRDAAAIPVAAI